MADKGVERLIGRIGARIPRRPRNLLHAADNPGFDGNFAHSGSKALECNLIAVAARMRHLIRTSDCPADYWHAAGAQPPDWRERQTGGLERYEMGARCIEVTEIAKF